MSIFPRRSQSWRDLYRHPLCHPGTLEGDQGRPSICWNTRKELRRLLKMVGESAVESGVESGRWIKKISAQPGLLRVGNTVMIEKVEIMREYEPSNERIGNFLSDPHRIYLRCLICQADNLISIKGITKQLRPFYANKYPTMPRYAGPHTVAFCEKNARMGRLQVATSKNICPLKFFLLNWVAEARKSRFFRKGCPGYKGLRNKIKK